MRAASYSRRSDSRGKRHDERSVEEQDELSLRAAHKNGWDLPLSRMYRDNELSASRYSNKTRDDWELLDREVSSGDLRVLIMYDTARIWRKLSEWVLLVDTCRDNRVLIHVTSHGRTYDPTNRRDRKTLIEEGVDSEDETEKTSERVRRAMDANKHDGLPHATPAYGYAIEVDPSNHRKKIRVPVPEIIPTVVEVLTRVAKSDPLSQIEKDLDARGIDPPSVALGLKPHPRSKGKTPKWSTAMLRRICTNYVYIGKRAFIEEVDGQKVEVLVKATWPPLVEGPEFEELFWKAHNLIKDPKRKTTKPGRQKHLAAFLVTCADCGSYLVRMGGQQPPERYKCSANTSCVTIRKTWLDDFLRDLVCARLAKPDVFKELTRRDNKDAYATLERLRGEHKEALDLRSHGKISLLALSQEEQRILPQVEKLELELRPIVLPQAVEDLVRGAEGNLRAIKARWATFGVPAQKDVVRTLLRDIMVCKAPVTGRLTTDQQIADMLRARVKFQWVGDAT